MRDRMVEIVSDVGARLIDWINPITASPAAPLETSAALDAFGPSFMPRASLHQGVAGGLAIIAARGTSHVVERATGRLTFGRSSLPARLAARAAVAGVGVAASRIPERADEPLMMSTVRSGGRLVVAGSVGGVMHDLAIASRDHVKFHRSARVAFTSVAAAAVVAWIARERLVKRNELIEQWTAADKPSSLPTSLAIAQAVTTVGRGLAVSYLGTRNLSVRFFGRGVAHQAVARTVNAAAWAGGVTTAYHFGISYVGRANEKVEPAYSVAPESTTVSGSPDSVAPFSELGLQGRRFVTDVVTPRLVEQTLGEPAIAEPIRVYVGFNTDPVYATGRAELALDELERTGAFERSHLLLVCPTGTGWIDQTMIESAELLTRGDIATCAIQYGRFPSFLCVQKVSSARSQFRALLWGVKERLRDRPPERRPRVLVFGESLGAWASSDVAMKDGIAGLDRYGVDKALWFGLPGLAKWSKTGMKEGRSPLAPEGTVGHFDRYEQLAAWSRDDQRALRVTVLDHDNDPIAVLAPRLMVRRPDWLLDHHRGRNVPESMSWIPIITFVQTAADAMNAMRTVPGEFKSFGHDYRADTARFVHTAFDLQAVTDEQMASVERVLREIEIERGARIAAARQHAESATQAQEAEAPHAPAGPSGASTADAPAHGERHRLHGRTHGAHWGRSLRRTRRGLDQRAAAG